MGAKQGKESKYSISKGKTFEDNIKLNENKSLSNFEGILNIENKFNFL